MFMTGCVDLEMSSCHDKDTDRLCIGLSRCHSKDILNGHNWANDTYINDSHHKHA